MVGHWRGQLKRLSPFSCLGCVSYSPKLAVAGAVRLPPEGARDAAEAYNAMPTALLGSIFIHKSIVVFILDSIFSLLFAPPPLHRYL